MQQYVEKQFVLYQWSPVQIKERCDKDIIAMVSIERIYQYIYEDQVARGSLYQYLRTARRKRKNRLHKKTTNRSYTG